jgi:hypothetical protein
MRAKQASKRKSRTKAVTILGVAGLLSATSGTSAAIVGPSDRIPTQNTASAIILGEEEISDVSLSTFYVYDKENTGTNDLGVQLARGGCGHGGCGHGGCAARGCRGCGGCHGCRGCARGCRGCGCGGCGGCGPGFCVSVGGFGFCG